MKKNLRALMERARTWLDRRKSRVVFFVKKRGWTLSPALYDHSLNRQENSK